MNASRQTTYDITFIIPVYNTAKFLAQCLDSIIAQNIDKQIIAIDDGSTDGSGEVLAQFAKRYDFIKIITQENKGVSAARNAGIKAAAGRYVYFVDSDDYLLPNIRFDDYIAIMDKENLAALKGCAIWEIQDEEVFLPALPKAQQAALDIYQHGTRQKHYLQIAPSSQYIQALLVRVFTVELWAYIFRTQHLRTHELYFDESLEYAEDLLFVTKVLTCAEFLMAETSEIFYFYRHRTGSAINQANNTAMFLSQIKAVKAVQYYTLERDFDYNTRHNILLLGLSVLAHLFESVYFQLDETAKAQIDSEVSLELFGMYQLYEILSARLQQRPSNAFSRVHAEFRQRLL
ncbi:hypothetical protein B0181_11220 [Moraxella caviae]|uniref:Chondroitin polymerase n=1 Tax=Moraxella caviae TaxID=34060 RepID=A0A1S9ZUD2_9GAMM|nr:glycosyltransferase [Moraxella caviae]OOR87068.1 hypothetical protein B0181_11220 [Moraxella caviae]STZ13808.1 Chondroitin polymerase [Moraxella caviae]VEW10615.1 Chondroitin polymerase [Moraxella caviae]